MDSIPRILSGIFGMTGTGLDEPCRLHASLAYTVPADKRAQIIYLRAGNSSDDLICLTLMRDGVPMRLFPVGAKAAQHVPLAVLEDLQPETRLEVFAAAPRGTQAQIVLDLGLIEI